MNRMLVAAAVVALIASPLSAQMRPAQAGEQRPMGMMGGMGGGGKESMGPLTAQFGKYAPAAVLAMKEHLSLTSAQEARLAELVEIGKKAESDAHMPAHAAHMELNKLLAAEPMDLEAVRKLFLAHHTAEGNTQWARASIAMQVKALLTPAQRTHVEQMGGGAGHH